MFSIFPIRCTAFYRCCIVAFFLIFQQDDHKQIATSKKTNNTYTWSLNLHTTLVYLHSTFDTNRFSPPPEEDDDNYHQRISGRLIFILLKKRIIPDIQYNNTIMVEICMGTSKTYGACNNS